MVAAAAAAAVAVAGVEEGRPPELEKKEEEGAAAARIFEMFKRTRLAWSLLKYRCALVSFVDFTTHY